jgi:hypothetical protein
VYVATTALPLQWSMVAYARNLDGTALLSFFQSLIEAAKDMRGVSVVARCQRGGAEVGNQRGREALVRYSGGFWQRTTSGGGRGVR